MKRPPKGPKLTELQRELIKLLARASAREFLKETEQPTTPLGQWDKLNALRIGTRVQLELSESEG